MAPKIINSKTKVVVCFAIHVLFSKCACGAIPECRNKNISSTPANKTDCNLGDMQTDVLSSKEYGKEGKVTFEICDNLFNVNRIRLNLGNNETVKKMQRNVTVTISPSSILESNITSKGRYSTCKSQKPCIILDLETRFNCSLCTVTIDFGQNIWEENNVIVKNVIRSFSLAHYENCTKLSNRSSVLSTVYVPTARITTEVPGTPSISISNDSNIDNSTRRTTLPRNTISRTVVSEETTLAKKATPKDATSRTVKNNGTSNGEGEHAAPTKISMYSTTHSYSSSIVRTGTQTQIGTMTSIDLARNSTNIETMNSTAEYITSTALMDITSIVTFTTPDGKDDLTRAERRSKNHSELMNTDNFNLKLFNNTARPSNTDHIQKKPIFIAGIGVVLLAILSSVIGAIILIRIKRTKKLQADQKNTAEEHTYVNIERLQTRENIDPTNVNAEKESPYCEVSKTWEWQTRNGKPDEIIYCEVEFAKAPAKRRTQPVVKETIYASIISSQTTNNS